MRRLFGCKDPEESEMGATPTIVVGGDGDGDGAPARDAHEQHYAQLPQPPTPLVSEVPPIIKHFTDILDEQCLTQRFRLGVVCADASFCIVEEQVRRGLTTFDQEMDVAVSGVLRRNVVLERKINGVAPHALSIVLAAHDASDMPFDTQLSLSGFSAQREQRLGHAQASDAPLRDQVLLRNSYAPRGSEKQRAMLARPLVCEEPITGTRFGSIEAIGFDSARLFDSVLTLVDSERAPEHCARLARLFGAHQSPLGTIVHASRGARASTGGGGGASASRLRFYLLPIEYEYTYLLVRVYTYLVMHALRNSSIYEVPPDAIDAALYEVPYSSEHLVFTHADLLRVVDFVNEHLVDVHPQFDPHRIRARLAPFDSASWVDAWNRVRTEERRRTHQTSDGAANCVLLGQHRTTPSRLQCSVKIFIFYALLPVPAPAPARSRTRARGANGVLDSYYAQQETFVDRLLAGTADEEDEDEDDGDGRRALRSAERLPMRMPTASASDDSDSSDESAHERMCRAATKDTLRSVLSANALDTTLDHEQRAAADGGDESTQRCDAYSSGPLRTFSNALPLDQSTPPCGATQSSPATFVWPSSLRSRAAPADERAAQSATSSADTESDERARAASHSAASPLTPHRFPPPAPAQRFARAHSLALRNAAYSADTVTDESAPLPPAAHGAADTNNELVSMDVTQNDACSDEPMHGMVFALDEVAAK